MEIFRMTKFTATAAAVIALAGAASAQDVLQFSVGLAATGNAAEGGAIDAISANADFFSLGVTAPASSSLNPPFGNPGNAFSSYVNIADGPQDPGNANPNLVAAVGGAAFSSNAFNGAWVSDPAFGAPVASGDDDAVFLGRFAVLGGEIDLSGQIQISVLREGDLSGNADESFYTLTIGADAVSLGGSQNQYFLDVREGQEDFGGGTIISYADVYLVAVPTPGAAGLLAVAGLAASRRRRG